MTAYALLALAILHAVDACARGPQRSVINGAVWLAGRGDRVQAVLGILTLLHQVPIDLALAHQAVAMVVLTLAVFQVERLAARRLAAPRKLSVPAGPAG